MKYNYNKLFFKMIEQDIRQKDLVERTGISASTFTRMKHHYPISMTALTRIADVLQCSENDLFERM